MVNKSILLAIPLVLVLAGCTNPAGGIGGGAGAQTPSDVAKAFISTAYSGNVDGALTYASAAIRPQYETDMAGLRQLFANGGVIRIDKLEALSEQIQGNQAAVMLDVAFTVTMGNETGSQPPVRGVFELIKENGAWKINSRLNPVTGTGTGTGQ